MLHSIRFLPRPFEPVIQDRRGHVLRLENHMHGIIISPVKAQYTFFTEKPFEKPGSRIRSKDCIPGDVYPELIDQSDRFLKNGFIILIEPEYKTPLNRDTV